MDDITTPAEPGRHSITDIVKEYGKRLSLFITRNVKNEDDAGDILQDVWYQLISIVETEPIEQVGAWLYRVTKNKIIDSGRKKKTLALEDFAYEDEDGALAFPEEMISEDTTPELELEKQEIFENVFLAVDMLPEKQKQVFVMNVLEDKTLQEIADLIGESIKTIISRKKYAVDRLRKILDEMTNDD